MSVISSPRRWQGAADPRRTTTAPSSPRHLTPVRSEVTERSLAKRRRRTIVASIVIVLIPALVMAYCSMVSGQRQMQIQANQAQYQTDLSNYGALVNSLTGESTPGIVAQKAQQLHLVQPRWVRQVPAASLATPLPLPTFTIGVTVRPRTSR